MKRNFLITGVVLLAVAAFLDGAFVADKVVGKGAAALMILGGVKEVFANVVSRPALALLNDAGVKTDYVQAVVHIVNRTQTGICPVEQLCSGCATAQACLPLIGQFIEHMKMRNEYHDRK